MPQVYCEDFGRIPPQSPNVYSSATVNRLTETQNSVANPKLWAVLAIATVASFIFIAHIPGANGPEYWHWDWRHPNAVRFYPFFFAVSVLVFIAIRFWRMSARYLAIALLTLAALGLKVPAMVESQDGSAQAAIRAVVRNRFSNSYFSDAVRVNKDMQAGRLTVHDLIAGYPKFMPNLGNHTRIRAPGLLLVNLAIIRLCGSDLDLAATILGWSAAALAALVVPMVYLLLRALRRTKLEAFCGSAFYALCPAPAMFFVSVDAIYPAVTCALIILWINALRRKKPIYALAFGAALAATCFFTFNLLVLGLFLLAITAIPVYQTRYRDLPRIATLALVAVAVATFIVIYLAAYFLTGLNLIAIFKSALVNQAAFAQRSGRAGLFTAGWDLYDFALGTGFIGLLLAASYIISGKRRLIPILCLVQILFIACTQLLAVETARVWMFMIPLLMVPVGAELARWKWRHLVAVYLALAAISAVVAGNLQVLSTGLG